MRFKATRLPIKVDVFNYRSFNDFKLLKDFCGDLISLDDTDVILYISSEENYVKIFPGDYVLKLSFGEYQVMSPKIFLNNYLIDGGVDV